MEVLIIQVKDKQTAQEILELITRNYGDKANIHYQHLPDVFLSPVQVDSYDLIARRDEIYGE